MSERKIIGGEETHQVELANPKYKTLLGEGLAEQPQDGPWEGMYEWPPIWGPRVLEGKGTSMFVVPRASHLWVRLFQGSCGWSPSGRNWLSRRLTCD